MPPRRLRRLALLALLTWAVLGAAHAETRRARCELRPPPAGAAAVQPCTYIRSGDLVSITLADGTRHDLTRQPQAGQYVDARGQAVRRSPALGTQGELFHFADRSLAVVWVTTSSPPAGVGAPGRLDATQKTDVRTRPAARPASR